MEALLYDRAADRSVRCRLCSHRCRIAPGGSGLCGVRQNREGILHTLVYGRLVAGHVDPIEKKPIFHLLPGSLSYSIATVGCNFRCRFCQNADIAQMPADQQGRIEGRPVLPEQVVASALENGCRSIAYTYTEPTVFLEFALETARLARRSGLFNVWVSNGYLTAEALALIGPLLDAANIDLKSFSERYYTAFCGARLAPVLETLRGIKALGILLEVTTLVVPGLNDGDAELRALAGFIAGDLGPETPWHVSRFHPTYRLLDRPATPRATLERARGIGLQAGLRHVYTGNLPGEAGEKTICPVCRELLIDRCGFQVTANRLRRGCCPRCRTPLHGLGLGAE
jgi:pyruvate formate lyase activating enzyme